MIGSAGLFAEAGANVVAAGSGTLMFLSPVYTPEAMNISRSEVADALLYASTAPWIVLQGAVSVQVVLSTPVEEEIQHWYVD